MPRRLALVACLVFSGLAALVYQGVWVRMLGFASVVVPKAKPSIRTQTTW